MSQSLCLLEEPWTKSLKQFDRTSPLDIDADSAGTRERRHSFPTLCSKNSRQVHSLVRSPFLHGIWVPRTLLSVLSVLQVTAHKTWVCVYLRVPVLRLV